MCHVHMAYGVRLVSRTRLCTVSPARTVFPAVRYSVYRSGLFLGI